MNKKLTSGLIAVGIVTTGALFVNVQTASAFVLHNDWAYTMDSPNDSSPFDADGGGAFEVFGSAYRIEDGKLVIAINSNVDLDNGVSDPLAADDQIHFSDLLLNFTGRSLDEANGDLFGIRFAANNDSGVSGIGVYSNVTAISVSGSNNGYGTLGAYNNYIISQGVTPDNGIPYLDESQAVLNSIQQGIKVGDISFISNLDSLGLDFGHFGTTGSRTIAFSLDVGLLPHSIAMYNLGMECDNDINVGIYNPEVWGKPVPTPAAILPILTGMLTAAGRRKRRQSDDLVSV